MGQAVAVLRGERTLIDAAQLMIEALAILDAHRAHKSAALLDEAIHLIPLPTGTLPPPYSAATLAQGSS